MLQSRKCLLACLLLLSIVMTAPVFAQNEEWYLNQRIEGFQFVGLERVPQNELDGLLEPFIGQLFTERLFADIQRRLYALDYFEYLLPEPIPANDQNTALILQFEVLERPVLGEIRFNGQRRIRESQLKDQILLQIGDIFSLPKIRIANDAILAFYKERGYPQAVSSFTVEELPNTDRRVIFDITEGPRTTVRLIEFEGNSFGTASALKSVLSSKEQGLFTSGLFRTDYLDVDREALLDYYEQNGFIDVEILDIVPEITISEDGTQATASIRYFISEGTRWTFGGIDFNGNEIFSDEQLRTNIQVREGETLNLPRLRSNLQQVIDVYLQSGYFNNEFDIQENRNPTTGAIQFSLNIVERSRSYIENIVITGNEKTKDHVIRRELPFVEGDVFSASRIREGLLNVYNLQYFEGVPLIETPQGTQPELRDVVISVEERRTLDVRGGFSVGGEGFPLSLLASVSDINFLGNGQNLGVQLNLSSKNQSLTTTFSDNYLFGDRIGGGVSLNFERQIIDNVPQDILGPIFFDQTVPDPFTSWQEYQDAGGTISAIPDDYLMSYEQYVVGLGFTSSIRRRTPLGWVGLGAGINTGLNFVNYDDDLYRPADAGIRNNLGSITLVNRLSVNASLDSRDVIFNPSTGGYLSQNFIFTGGLLLGNKHYIRSESSLQHYFTLFHTGDEPIGNFRLVLAMNTSLSLLLPQFWTSSNYENLTVNSNDRLFTNSMSVARGWNTIGNGEAIWNNWVELRMPISEQIIWWDNYVEAVRLTENRGDIFSQGPSGWKFGFGSGLRLTIPQLPLRLYLAKRFDLDETGNVRWQAGNLFSEPGTTKGLDLIFAISLF